MGAWSFCTSLDNSELFCLNPKSRVVEMASKYGCYAFRTQKK